ncbi:Aldose-ketose isomerase YihS [Salmonella enterica subsp. enterica]|nr:Aldose-ketose isomerase YihS [Salmonella enterica subsp. enterica]
MRWPIVEAMGTAYALHTLTGDSQYEEWYQKWWDYCIKYLMDYENGSWWQELDADNKVTTKVWDGKQIFTICCTVWSFLVCHWRRAWLRRSRRVSWISTRNRS